MTRVWSMASERRHSDCDQREIENAIIYVCNGADQQSSAQTVPPTSLQTSLPSLPPDNDSGYEASPSSATRLASFQFGSPIDSTEEDLLSIDLIFAPIMLLENDGSDDYQEVDDQHIEGDNEEPMRTESRNSGGSSGSERMASSPISIPIAITSRNSLTQTSHLTERSRMSSPLSLSHSNMTFATNSNRFLSDYNERGFGGEMFGRHHRHRYHIGIDAISPQSPPSSTYWSQHLMGMVSPVGPLVGPRSHHNNHNHYMTSDENVTSAQSSLSLVPDIQLLSPSSSALGSQVRGRLTATSNTMDESREDPNNNQPLPDVVNVEVRMRAPNGHSQARRAVSVSLPIDAQTIRSVGMSLRRISEEFEISNSRTMLSNWRSGSGSDGMVGNILASLRLSRRSLSAGFRSHYIHLNGRPRSFSTNDAPEE